MQVKFLLIGVCLVVTITTSACSILSYAKDHKFYMAGNEGWLDGSKN